jgi:hypothetical protein
MSFDLDRLCSFCDTEIRLFAAEHPDEAFYAFAFEGSWLSLNSEQEFAKTLAKFQEESDRRNRPIERWEDLTEDDLWWEESLLDTHATCKGLDRSNRLACLAIINESRACRRERIPYRNPEDVRGLRENPGDWAYQGFADMVESGGFDEAAYDEHWYMSDEKQKVSEYGRATDALLERLRKSGVFACLKTAPEFYAKRVEHNY